MTDNMRYYEQWRAVPREAQTPIKAGRLKGMTDINPVWRMKVLTEMFGPCGTGWKYDILKREFVPGNGGEISVFVDINLYYRENGEWSDPIPGTGGSKYVAQETKGLYTDDEAPKKALTDALSVACKALGIGADIYFASDRTKYSAPQQAAQETADTPAQAQPKAQKPETNASPKAQKPEIKASPMPTEGLNVNLAMRAGKVQIEYIKQHATDEEYLACMQKYGAELETMPYAVADLLVTKLRGRQHEGNA